MIEDASDSKNIVISKRFYDFPVKQLYAFWSDARHLQKWFAPSDEITTTIFQMEFYKDGQYRFGFDIPGREGLGFVRGKYIEIIPLEKIIFTWIWEEPDPHAGEETVVSVFFFDKDGGCEVVVMHERFSTGEMRERHQQGWVLSLLQLEKFVKIG